MFTDTKSRLHDGPQTHVFFTVYTYFIFFFFYTYFISGPQLVVNFFNVNNKQYAGAWVKVELRDKRSIYCHLKIISLICDAHFYFARMPSGGSIRLFLDSLIGF